MLQKGWGRLGSNHQLSASKTQHFTVIVGQDKKISDKWRAGILLAYGKQMLHDETAKGEADDVRIAAYGRYGSINAANVEGYRPGHPAVDRRYKCYMELLMRYLLLLKYIGVTSNCVISILSLKFYHY